MDLLLSIEIAAVILGLAYVFLIMYEKIWCWPVGIIGSLLSVYLFYAFGLYSEAILYFYYVLIGIYGWIIWSKPKDKELEILQFGITWHLWAILIGLVLSALLGYFMSYIPSATRPYVDATTTIFSFIASYMQAKKILSSWLFWVAINLFSIWLYFDRGLEYYGLLMILYFQLSAQGYFQWKTSLLKNGKHLSFNSTLN